MNLIEAKDFCVKWFAENQVSIPQTAREWSKGRSGKTVPPGMTYQTLRRKGIRVGDLLELLLDTYTNRVKNKQNDFSFLASLGLEFISVDQKETVTYRCNSCEDTHQTLKGTLRRWESSGKKYCSICRKSSGKVKDISYYNNLVKGDYEVVSLEPGSRLKLKHTVCNNTFTRARGYITSHLNEAGVCCPYCYSGPYFIHNSNGFMSKIEETIVTYILSMYPFKVEREVLYSTLMDTNRMFRLDVWLPDIQVGFEITSKGNNLPNYHKNLNEKLSLARDNNVLIYAVTSTSHVEDIVRPLLKDKEERVTNAP